MAFRNDDPDAALNVNGPGKDGYTDGQPGLTAPTPCRDQDLNMLQEEICKTVEGVGMTLESSRDGEDQGQLLQALLSQLSSMAADTWTEGAAAGGVANLVAVAASDTTLVTGNGLGGTIHTSTNKGQSWSSTTVSGLSLLSEIKYENGLFFLLGIDGASNAAVFRSPDAITWTACTLGTTHGNLASGVVWDGSQYVLVGGDWVETSPDGVTWTTQTFGTVSGSGIVSLAFGGGVLCAVGDSDTLTSNDGGVTWVARATTVTGLRDVAYGAGRFVAFGSSGAVQTSTNGVTWNVGTTPLSVVVYRVEWNGGLFLTASFQRRMQSSPDGINWSVHHPEGVSSTKTDWDICWNGRHWTTVGSASGSSQSARASMNYAVPVT